MPEYDYWEVDVSSRRKIESAIDQSYHYKRQTGRGQIRRYKAGDTESTVKTLDPSARFSTTGGKVVIETKRGDPVPVVGATLLGDSAAALAHINRTADYDTADAPVRER